MKEIVYRCVRTNQVTQRFGENKIPDYKYMGMLGHNGIDRLLYKTERLYFPVVGGLGWIAKPHVDQKGGIGVDVISKEPYEDGFYRKYRFWHLLSVIIEDGAEVTAGTLLGLGDSTGLSKGHHVHESRKRCLQDGTAVDDDNGYYGAIEYPWIDTFILDHLGIKEETPARYWCQIKTQLRKFRLI